MQLYSCFILKILQQLITSKCLLYFGALSRFVCIPHFFDLHFKNSVLVNLKLVSNYQQRKRLLSSNKLLRMHVDCVRCKFNGQRSVCLLEQIFQMQFKYRKESLYIKIHVESNTVKVLVCIASFKYILSSLMFHVWVAFAKVTNFFHGF